MDNFRYLTTSTPSKGQGWGCKRLLVEGSHVCCPPSSLCSLYPRKAISFVLSIANLNLVLTCLTTSQYLSFLFLAIRSANLLINCLHSFDIPPDVRNTARVNVAFSTFNTLSRYSSFFSFSFFSYNSLRVFVLFDKQLGCETLMSRKVLSNGVCKKYQIQSCTTKIRSSSKQRTKQLVH